MKFLKKNKNIWKMVILLIATLFNLVKVNLALVIQARTGELLTYKIEPQLFNWTHQFTIDQFRYRPMRRGYPDLPSWLRYMYSKEYHGGFLYGTPPESIAGKSFNLDIVALNRQNFETRHVVATIFTSPKLFTPNIVQMKIDNLNWVHLMDPGRIENLRNIFRRSLWPESVDDLCVVFMESAVNMGGRLPLQPQQREGVIVHLGSLSKFSPRLLDLNEEVRPLYKLPTCTFKRTSVQKLFENAGFKLDWCAFRMVDIESKTEILYHNQIKYGDLNTINQNKRRTCYELDDVPPRNYIDEIAFTFAIPSVFCAVLVGILSAVLCFHEK